MKVFGSIIVYSFVSLTKMQSEEMKSGNYLSYRSTQEWVELEKNIVECRKCPRLVSWREQVARERRRAYKDSTYWGRPVPGFGDRQGSVLVVGLAPGAHGANRTGRMFTGDGSGIFLYNALYRAGFANQPESRHLDDGLALRQLFISAVCRCAPPGNKPDKEEISNCLPYLAEEIRLLEKVEVIVALGKIAFDSSLKLFREQGYDISRHSFGHAKVFKMSENLPWMVASYHPSRQNTQTGRLTSDMFAEIWEIVNRLLINAGG
jgi:uracil-DNA glycosylase